MRTYLALPSIILLFVLIYFPLPGIPESASAKHLNASGTKEIDPNAAPTTPESQAQMVKLTDRGIEPTELTIKQEDSIAFFLNGTNESLVTLEINFKGHPTHCASLNMQIGEDGIVKSSKPIAPQDFASTCFHDTGKYDFTVYGLASNPEGVKGSIIVQ